MREKYGFRPLSMIAYDWLFGWSGLDDRLSGWAWRAAFSLFLVLIGLPLLLIIDLPGGLLALVVLLLTLPLHRCSIDESKAKLIILHAVTFGYRAGLLLVSLPSVAVGAPLLLGARYPAPLP